MPADLPSRANGRPLRASRRPQRTVLAAPAAALVALTLAGCSLQPPGAAAVVGSDVVTTTQLQQATDDLAALQGAPTQAQVLVFLILEPFVLERAEAEGVGVSDADALRELEGVPSPSEPAVETVRSALAFMRLQDLDPATAQTAVEEVLAALQEADIEVNPRYGTFDPSTLMITPEALPWLESGELEGGELEGGEPEGGEPTEPAPPTP